LTRSGTKFALSIDELRELANAQILAICQKILPNGRENCGYWEVGSIEGEPGQSLKVNLRGATKGLWTDFSAAKGSPSYAGNVIQLVAQVEFGGNVGEACKWLRRWLGIDDLDPDALAKSKAKAARAQEKGEDDARKKAERNRRNAHNLYLSAAPYPGTIVETYLCSRGLDFRARDLHASAAIKFHPQVYCAEAGKKLPAMVGTIVGLDGRYLGAHRTWLQPDGSGKATLVEAKKSLGKFRGGFIPLWKGAIDKPLKDLPPGTPIYVSEGIEDGLSVALTKPELRVIAAISLSNIGALELPDHCPVYILGQRDTKLRAIESFETAVAALQERGYAVFLVWPPDGFKDYNDVLRGERMDPDGDPPAPGDGGSV
jgi:hypothetical protein